jgi:peptide/nickel transport system permease protein
MWVDLARIVRGQVFTIRELEYVQAAKILGFSDVRIMLRHILPNITGPILVIAAANFASAILLEAGFELFGFGCPASLPQLGSDVERKLWVHCPRATPTSHWHPG